MKAKLLNFWNNALSYEGPTQGLGLFRIFLICIIWAEHGRSLQLFRDITGTWYIFSIFFFIASTAMLVGYKTRLATFLVGALLVLNYYFFGKYLHYPLIKTTSHGFFLFMTTLCLALTPCGRSLSLDRWFAIRKAKKNGDTPPLEWGPLWPLHLIAFQTSMVYFWGAWNKTFYGFINGDRIEQIIMFFYTGSQDPQPWWIGTVAVFTGVFTVAVEYFLAIGLWFKKTRWLCVILGIIFHWAIYVTLPVMTFSVLIILNYMAYMDQRVVRDNFHSLVAGKEAEASYS